jgi:hypothetical protein
MRSMSHLDTHPNMHIFKKGRGEGGGRERGGGGERLTSLNCTV